MMVPNKWFTLTNFTFEMLFGLGALKNRGQFVMIVILYHVNKRFVSQINSHCVHNGIQQRSHLVTSASNV